jgi:hypothetical protein
MKFAIALALGSILHPELKVRDINGVERSPLTVEGKAAALFFVTNDCPVSNYYSHEIRRICDGYSKQGVSCSLVYVDPTMTGDQVRQHAQEYGHGDYPKFIDRRHELVKATGAEITPTVVVIRRDASIAYRGRIDNFYADFGKPRRMVTEHDLRDALDAVIAARPIAKSETKPVGCYIPDLKIYEK